MVLPANTGLGVPTFVTARLAVVAAPTIVSTVAELFVSVGSFVPEVTESVSVICVPVAVPRLTVTTTVNVVTPDAPEGTSASLQVITPAVVAQLQPAAPR